MMQASAAYDQTNIFNVQQLKSEKMAGRLPILRQINLRYWEGALKFFSGIVLATAIASATPAPYRTAIPATFDSRGADREAIDRLLANYTKAVSTKDQALFESLLLNRAIPFSGVPLSQKAQSTPIDAANYEDFRKGVFEGEPFTQEFKNVHVEQDGMLAQVSLVFVNTTATNKSWGWKTMQLVKVTGRWKIAAEFFTGHT